MKIGGLLKKTHMLHSQRINEELKRYDLTMSQLDVLIRVIIASEENLLINQRDIERSTNLTNPTVTGLINRLEAKGLIQRIENEKDRRIKNLYMTEKAECLNKEIKLIFDESDSIALKDFSEEEKQELEGYLLRVMNNLKKGERE